MAEKPKPREPPVLLEQKVYNPAPANHQDLNQFNHLFQLINIMVCLS